MAQMVYGIFTAGQRTWGGPRADAGAADANTTPQQVIEKAIAEGDDLNVIPETFKPAVEAQNNQLVRTSMPLLPPDQVEGRFTAAERLPGGWYQQGNDSLVSSRPVGLSAANGRNPLHPRDSFDSNFSAGTNTSVYMPRRVESIMGEEDRKKYAMAQASQRDPGGAYFMGGPPLGHMYNPGQVYEIHEADLKKAGFTGSVESLESYHDRLDQKRIESYNGMGGSPERSPTETTPGSGALTAPQSSSGENRRSGRSPLARVSLMRSLPNDESAIELQNQRQQSQSPDSAHRQSPSKPGPSRGP
jgi:chitin synthase